MVWPGWAAGERPNHGLGYCDDHASNLDGHQTAGQDVRQVTNALLANLDLTNLRPSLKASAAKIIWLFRKSGG